MRIDEHIYQGFFGLKKKKDARKYYHESVDKLKGLDSDLDDMINSFQTVLANHNNKIKSYLEFLKNQNKDTLQALRKEIEKLEGMFDQDELANDNEKKCCIKGISILQGLTTSEDSTELGQLEKDTLMDLSELMRLLKAMEPLWQQQIDFIEKEDEKILGDKKNVKILSDIFKEEEDILKMEESLLKKIDLKTGTLLRKTSLKEKDIERTKDMGMNYREIKYVR